MAVYSSTRDELVEMICRLMLNDWWEGTATGGSTTTLVDTSRLEEDDYFNSRDSYLYLRTGTYKGSNLKISDFVNSTNTITFGPALAGAVSASDTYSIHARFTRDEVIEAINIAIEKVAEDMLVQDADETVALTTSTFEYVLPATIIYVTDVAMGVSGGEFRDVISRDQYRFILDSPPKIQFKEFAPVTGKYLRVNCYRRPTALTTDDSICDINPSYVMFQAAAYLHLGHIRVDDPYDHRAQAQMCQAEADKELIKQLKLGIPPEAEKIAETEVPSEAKKIGG